MEVVWDQTSITINTLSKTNKVFLFHLTMSSLSLAYTFFNNQPRKCQHKDNYVTCLVAKTSNQLCNEPAGILWETSHVTPRPPQSRPSLRTTSKILFLGNTPPTNQNYLCIYYTPGTMWATTDTDLRITSRSLGLGEKWNRVMDKSFLFKKCELWCACKQLGNSHSVLRGRKVDQTEKPLFLARCGKGRTQGKALPPEERDRQANTGVPHSLSRDAQVETTPGTRARWEKLNCHYFRGPRHRGSPTILWDLLPGARPGSHSNKYWRKIPSSVHSGREKGTILQQPECSVLSNSWWIWRGKEEVKGLRI